MPKGSKMHEGGPNIPVKWGRGDPIYVGAPNFYDTGTHWSVRPLHARRRVAGAERSDGVLCSAIAAHAEEREGRVRANDES